MLGKTIEPLRRQGKTDVSQWSKAHVLMPDVFPGNVLAPCDGVAFMSAAHPDRQAGFSPTAQQAPFQAVATVAPKRKLMSVSQSVWDALAADWPELGADGVDDLVDLKAFEMSQSTASLNGAGVDPSTSLAVSTPEGWVYLENDDPVSIYALEQDVYRQAESTPAAQGYKLQAVPYDPPFKYS